MIFYARRKKGEHMTQLNMKNKCSNLKQEKNDEAAQLKREGPMQYILKRKGKR
jgi:hypothetical protein